MAIGSDFVAKLLPALDELEARWRAGTISADEAIAFCLRCRQRLGIRPELEALRQRVKVTLDAAMAARESSPGTIGKELDELERRWGRSENDNYRDDFDECSALLSRTAARSAERARVLAVLASVLDEATSAAKTDASIRAYLGDRLDRARWKRLAGEPLPAAMPRTSFGERRRSSSRAATGSAKRSAPKKRANRRR